MIHSLLINKFKQKKQRLLVLDILDFLEFRWIDGTSLLSGWWKVGCEKIGIIKEIDFDNYHMVVVYEEDVDWEIILEPEELIQKFGYLLELRDWCNGNKQGLETLNKIREEKRRELLEL